jgi:hypothetical protein
VTGAPPKAVTTSGGGAGRSCPASDVPLETDSATAVAMTPAEPMIRMTITFLSETLSPECFRGDRILA